MLKWFEKNLNTLLSRSNAFLTGLVTQAQQSEQRAFEEMKRAEQQELRAEEEKTKADHERRTAEEREWQTRAEKKIVF